MVVTIHSSQARCDSVSGVFASQIFSQKYGFDIPSPISHAKKLYEKNGNTFWKDAIRKEMMNVGISFDLL